MKNLKQIIKEEIKRILSEDIEEAYQLFNLNPKQPEIDPDRGERDPQDSYIYLKPSTEKLLKRNQHIRVLRKPETPDVISGVAIRSTLLEPQNMKRLPYDINPMFKRFLSTANNIGGKITLPTRDTGPEDYTILNNVNIGREGRLSFFVPNPKKKLNEHGAGRTPAIRGMVNMLFKDERMTDAPLALVKALNLLDDKTAQELNFKVAEYLKPTFSSDPNSPSNTAAIKAMIDMDKEKGRRPSLD
tara:strand:- start:115 stop:846 length:732 start_codon:yes stop_codon:yes gene_type:complete